ncbi:SDR family oxidoreductase [Novosphingobium sp.]|uniref:SDR family NAD(P)-dependent oxidoreductase n=1 Tax=Novosphingobium sp. TaxID=1874826 RepID=UPI0022CB516C|nr:SDR family oxidoreductase [Novosphingobium sp.]MCZ8018239.1 SDR family oxidoreductase [Novosphingobium sp.]MCZ8033233.1 SDR family oxidoreductase [Novosphingobium sp.]MCZ8051688.1 SDR family oxidoreductase [Novosphingobium sp.]MCZ8060230.1 SDR family oxidoreductase [Novosphingobium sp.]MCZ8231872.1 SDR family oxidoreductase [Novosphingobium sp.]
MADLDGRIALVTGAGKGLGAATARALAAAGAKVAVTDLVAPTELATEIGGIARAQDVTSESDWEMTMDWLRAETGGLDVLVNNAGLWLFKPILATTLDDWRRLHAVNVEGVFLGTRAAAPLLAERAYLWRGGTAIVNLSSVAGIEGAAGATCYNSTKGAVRLFTKGCAKELAAARIRVNSVHPGVIDTDMGRHLIDDFAAAQGVGNNEVMASVSAMHPLGHLGEPQNVADAVVFLASDRAAFTTGSELIVDGGLSA